MRGLFATLGAISGAVTVGTGAFGAHALRHRLDAHALEVWEKAVHWQAIHALALLLVAAAARLEPDGRPGGPPGLRIAGWSFVAGTVLFSGSLYALALSGATALGAVTPFGGGAWLVGWCALAIALRPRRS
jgi:uncharacterized membrane protein YgdD (TMEM256/DUF423 family)